MSSYIPTPEEVQRIHEIRDHLLNTVKSILEKSGIKAKVLATGSTAKDTFVSGNTDIDIFIVTTDYKRAYNLLKQNFPSSRRKEGAMDILHFIHEGYDVDLVFIPPDHPRMETLIHTEFMNKNLTPQLKKEAIRAKAFFKSRGVYGAEIGGIVGIAIEELIRRYGKLEAVCEALQEYKEIPFIPDPANPNRNLLASIKPIRWKQIKEACRQFLETKQFQYRRFTKEDYLSSRRGWNNLFFSRLRDRPTDFHTALSICNHSLNEIRNREPEVKGTCDAYVFNEVIISYDVYPRKLPKRKIHCGPALHMKEAVETFKSIYKNTFVKDGRICTIVEREHTDIAEWMKELITKKMTDRGYKYLPEQPSV